MSVLTKLMGLAKATVADDPRRYLTNDLAKTLDRIDQLAYAQRSLLVNGGFEVWQRGTGPFTTNGAYTADRWAINLGGTGTISVSKDTANQDSGSTSCAKIVYTHNANSDLHQPVENFGELGGRTISASCRVKTSTPNAAFLNVDDGLNGVSSPVHSGSGNYETLSITFTPRAVPSRVLVNLILLASCTLYLDNATLVISSVPAPYAPLTLAEEWGRCQRYRQVVRASLRWAAKAAAETVDSPVYWQTRPAIAPTVTLSIGGSANLSGGTAVLYGANEQGARMEAGSAAAGDTYALDCTVTAEANP